MFSTTETEEERCMDSLPQIPERNYRPHTYETRLHCCKRVRESRWPIRKVAQYYHVKKPSLYRWLKRYDQRGEGALRDLPHRPITPATSGRWTSSSSPRNASRRSSRATSPITNTRSWTRRPGRGSSITPTSIRCSSR